MSGFQIGHSSRRQHYTPPPSWVDIRDCLARVIDNARQTSPKGAFARIRIKESFVCDVVVTVDPNDDHVILRMMSISPPRQTARDVYTERDVAHMTSEVVKRLLWVVCSGKSGCDGNMHPHAPLLEVDCSGNDQLRQICTSMSAVPDCDCNEGQSHADTCQDPPMSHNLLIYAYDIQHMFMKLNKQ